MSTYDLSYKAIFSDRVFITDLIRYFIDESSLKDIDFDSLEKVNQSYVTEDAQKKESDLIWKVKFKDDHLYLYFLIEFQSRVDRFMAIRLGSYLCLLYEDLIKSQKLKRLPPVLPWVIYNGDRPWNAARDPRDLLHPQVPKALKAYCPSFHYRLLDMGRYPLEDQILSSDENLPNLVAPLIAFEQHRRRSDIALFAKNIFERLNKPDQREFVKSFATYISTVLNLKGLSDDLEQGWEGPQEISKMLYERIKRSDEEVRSASEHIGLQKGEHLGLFEALELLILQKFGEFPLSLRLSLQGADIKTLQKGLKHILFASSLEDFLKKLNFPLAS